jgi:hypothetical protein
MGGASFTLISSRYMSQATAAQQKGEKKKGRRQAVAPYFSYLPKAVVAHSISEEQRLVQACYIEDGVHDIYR